MGLLELLGLKPKINFKELYKNGAIIVDVRTPREFNSGHFEDSINIPLDKIEQNINKIKKKNKPVITVCQSGIRSGKAASIMKRIGVVAYNGGPWSSLESKLN